MTCGLPGLPFCKPDLKEASSGELALIIFFDFLFDEFLVFVFVFVFVFLFVSMILVFVLVQGSFVALVALVASRILFNRLFCFLFSARCCILRSSFSLGVHLDLRIRRILSGLTLKWSAIWMVLRCGTVLLSSLMSVICCLESLCVGFHWPYLFRRLLSLLSHKCMRFSIALSASCNLILNTASPVGFELFHLLSIVPTLCRSCEIMMYCYLGDGDADGDGGHVTIVDYLQPFQYHGILRNGIEEFKIKESLKIFKGRSEPLYVKVGCFKNGIW